MHKTLLSLWFACLLPAVLQGSEAAQKRLYILQDGGEHFGKVILSTPKRIFINNGERVITIIRESIVRTVSIDALPREYQTRRKAVAYNTDALTALGAWCHKVALKKEARLHYEQALKLDKNHEQARKALARLLAEMDNAIPWQAHEKPVIRLFTLNLAGKDWKTNPDEWKLAQALLKVAKPSFAILPADDRERTPDYLLVIKSGAKLEKENTFYDDVVLSQGWVGVSRLYIYDGKTRKKRFTMEPVFVRKNLSTGEHYAEKIRDRAFKTMLLAIRDHPGFRIPKGKVKVKTTRTPRKQ